MLLWPYHDLPPDHPAFVAANVLSIQGIWRPDADSIFFQPERRITKHEWQLLLDRVPADIRKRIPTKVPATRAAAVQTIAAEN